MDRQGSPSSTRSAAMRLAEMARFWSPNNARQARERAIPATQSAQQMLHTLRPSPLPPPMSRSRTAVSCGSLVPPGSTPSPQQAEQQAQPGPHQPHAQVLWRSMTPSTFVYSCYRQRQMTARPASTGPRLVPTRTIEVDGQPTQARPQHPSQPSNTNSGLWPGSWAILADRNREFISPQHHACPPVQLAQRSYQLPCASGMEGSPSIQSRFKEDGRPPFTLYPAAVAREHCPLPLRQRPARGNSPGLQCWRPHSVPPQGSSDFRLAGSPNSLHPSNVSRANVGRGVPRLSPAQKPQKMKVEVNVSRSASTPPVPVRQFPSLASRFWSFFRGLREQTVDCEREADKKRVEHARAFPSDNLPKGRHPVPTVRWAHTPRGFRHQVEQIRGKSQQPTQHPQTVNSPGSRPPSPNLNLRQGPCCQSSVRLPQADVTGYFVPKQDAGALDRSPDAPVNQEQNSRDISHEVPQQQRIRHSGCHLQLP